MLGKSLSQKKQDKNLLIFRPVLLSVLIVIALVVVVVVLSQLTQ